MAGNKSLKAAVRAKEDEFYTQLTDIEKELRHYIQHFRDKTILCNCDDPFESNFFKYFVLNFNRLGIKKLIATCYATSPIMGSQLHYHVGKDGQMSFSFGDESDTDENTKHPYKAVVTKVYDKTGDGGVDMLDVAELFISGENQLAELHGDGDFRSDECLELLMESDIVVTNPPFSLFREYVSTLLEYNKHFIIIGSQNAITYKEFFPLLMQNKVWLGYGNGDMSFRVPEYFEPRETRFWIDEDGQKWRSLGNIAWFTNLDIRKRHEEMILVRRYNTSEYPQYDNYDAIEVSKTADIPCDFNGVMGVPITFMYKYNPDQFEIVGLVNGKDYLAGIKTTRNYKDYSEVRQNGTKTGSGGGKINGNPVLKGKPKSGNYFVFNDEVVHSTYARIFIRNKRPEEANK